MGYVAAPFKHAGPNNWMVYRDGREGHLVEQDLSRLHAATLAGVLNTVLIEARRAKRHRGIRKSPPNPPA
jgi:hypothetical protein